MDRIRRTPREGGKEGWRKGQGEEGRDIRKEGKETYQADHTASESECHYPQSRRISCITHRTRNTH